MTRRAWIWVGLGAAALLVVSLWGWQSWMGRDPGLLLAQAQQDYQAGRYDEAAAQLERLALLRAPTAMDHLARALVARARGMDALAELAQIPDSHELASEAHLLAGQIQLEKRRAREAEAQFKAALAVNSANAHAHRELAVLYNMQGRLQEMDRHMEALSELNAVGLEHLVHWGKTHNGAWNAPQDTEALARFLEADPDDRNTRLALADGLRRLGHLDESGSVLACLPDADPEARARRAILALDQGDAQRADELLSGGPADDPTLAKARGLLALHRRDAPAAVRCLRVALTAHPADFSLLSGMAAALRILGQRAEAREYLEAEQRHTNLTPLIGRATTVEGLSDPTLLSRIGAACEAAGRMAEARAWYRLAIARDPLDSLAQEGLYRVPPARAKSARFANGREPVRPIADSVETH